MFYANPCLAEVSAWVDNNPVVVGEMFRFYVEAKNVDDPEEPDLSEIRGLQVLNRSVQNQTSIVGTSITRTLKWTYVMLAPTSGNYLILSSTSVHLPCQLMVLHVHFLSTVTYTRST